MFELIFGVLSLSSIHREKSHNLTMSSHKPRRVHHASGSLLKYLITAFIVCIVTTYLIYRHISSPHRGGIPRVFLQEMTSNMSRVLVKSRPNRTLLNYVNTLATESFLVKTERKSNLHNVSSCIMENTNSVLLNASSYQCSHLMNITGSIGRTGNQLFQIATLLGTALKHNYTPFIRPSFPLNRWFDLPNLIDLQPLNNRRFSVNKSGTYSDTINNLDHFTNWSLTGYFQSFKYFVGAEHIVRTVLKIKNRFINNAKTFLGNITKPGTANVCVHIRRGDMNTKQLRKDGYSIPKLGYIDRAMNYFRRKFEDKVQFIIVSDGMFWCKDNISGDDVLFSPFYDTPDDLALMTLCDHVIITSGTFGWWGAWLADGITVYYKGYPGKGTWLQKQINVSDYYPSNWIGLW